MTADRKEKRTEGIKMRTANRKDRREEQRIKGKDGVASPLEDQRASM